MTTEQKKLIGDIILTPFSWLYKLGVVSRNLLFDVGLLKQKQFEVPVIVVGNLAVGGTGKTPHTEFLVSVLSSNYNIGVLSRGYKRWTKGFVLANSNLSSTDIGDEPYQMYRKFYDTVTIAVCEKRVEGIKSLLEINPNINLLVLDDAFQHRYVKPKVSIVLTEYKHLPCDDKMLPLGNLREPASGLARADIVIVTKCPKDLKPIEINVMKKKLNLAEWQKLYFTTYVYKNLIPVFPSQEKYLPDLNWLTPNDTILVFTGIANPVPMVKYLRQFNAKVKVIHFGDHHNFTKDDFEFIERKFESLKGDRKFMITTEKDTARIINHPYFPHSMRNLLFYLPIEVRFLQNQDEFIQILNDKINEVSEN